MSLLRSMKPEPIKLLITSMGDIGGQGVREDEDQLDAPSQDFCGLAKPSLALLSILLILSNNLDFLHAITG